MADNLDYALALSLQAQFDNSPTQQAVSTSLLTDNCISEYNPSKIVDETWELVDPNPNIHNLYVQFDQMFFKGRLVSRGVVVSWSNRMTL